jgi:cardiolipin synthase
MRTLPLTALMATMLLACLLLAAGCAKVPDVDGDLNSPGVERPEIVGAHGPLSAGQRQAVLAQLKQQGRDTDLLDQHLAIEQAVAHSPLVIGNRTTILHDGDNTFPAMFRAMHAAKNHINLEYYIIEDIENDGERLGDLLVAKRREGVTINLIYDSLGSIGTPREFFDRLRDAGISVVEFNPINPLKAKNGYSLNDRDHRKILVVDGKLAIIGGVNLYSGYQNRRLSKLTGSDAGSPDYWHDTDLQIEGPAVAEIQRLFFDHWAAQKGQPLDRNNYFPTDFPPGTETLRILGSDHEDLLPRYYATLISAFRDAEKNIFLTAAYFVPTDQELEALEEAAQRGVDVRLLLPSKSDSDSALNVGRSHYSDLLEAGIKIYEIQGQMLHSKTVTIDGVWSIIGSSNFDHRSVLFNDEIDAVILGRNTAAQLETLFHDDMKDADPVELSAWEDRPFWNKVSEMRDRIWQSLL